MTNFTKINASSQVAVRVRPPTNLKEDKCIQILSKKSLFFDDGSKNRPKKYIYDYVFSEQASQDEVYQTTTSPLIKDVLNGLSAAVFAYGATGSGKTHTMLGPNPRKAATPISELPPKTTSNQGDGLMVKAIDEIFLHVEESEKPPAFKVIYLKTVISLSLSNLIRQKFNPKWDIVFLID